jgi:hypothetical protein
MNKKEGEAMSEIYEKEKESDEFKELEINQ